MTVKVAGVHTDERKIDLELISSTPAPGKRGGPKPKAAAKKGARKGAKKGAGRKKPAAAKGGDDWSASRCCAPATPCCWKPATPSSSSISTAAISCW